MEWTDIESDQGVFTELIERFGVATPLKVEELWSVDADSLRQLGDVYGLVFLFKWVKESDPRPCLNETEAEAEGIFFTNQVIQNACATQAILHVLLNNKGIDVGQELAAFRDFTCGFPPPLRGEALSNSDLIRAAHNSFALPDAGMWADKDKSSKSGEAFHFIAYVPVGSSLYELDGLKEGPVKLSELSPNEDWRAAIGPHIEARIQRYASSEIRFNLMAIVGDPRPGLREQIEALRAAEGEGEMSDMGALGELQARLAEEEERRQRWRDENIRRRHNYTPLILELLTALGEEGRLGQLMEEAKRRAEAKAAAAAAGGKA